MSSFGPTHRYVESSNGGRGGKKLEIALSCLTDAAKAAYCKRYGSQGSGIDQLASPCPAQAQENPLLARAVIVCPGLADWQDRIAAARFDLVSEYIKVKERARKLKAQSRKKTSSKNKKKVSVCKAADDFVAAYNGQISPDAVSSLNALSGWGISFK